MGSYHTNNECIRIYIELYKLFAIHFDGKFFFSYVYRHPSTGILSHPHTELLSVCTSFLFISFLFRFFHLKFIFFLFHMLICWVARILRPIFFSFRTWMGTSYVEGIESNILLVYIWSDSSAAIQRNPSNHEFLQDNRRIITDPIDMCEWVWLSSYPEQTLTGIQWRLAASIFGSVWCAVLNSISQHINHSHSIYISLKIIVSISIVFMSNLTFIHWHSSTLVHLVATIQMRKATLTHNISFVFRITNEPGFPVQ